MIDVTVFWAKKLHSWFGYTLFLTRSQDVKDIHNKIITSVDISCPHSNWSYSKYPALQRSTLFVILTYSIGFQVIKLGFPFHEILIAFLMVSIFVLFVLSLMCFLKLCFCKKKTKLVICEKQEFIIIPRKKLGIKGGAVWLT